MRDGGSKGEGMDRRDKNLVQAIGKEETAAREELANRWGSYDQTKRMRCVADKGIADYSSLKDCLERAVMEKSQDQNQASAAAVAEANHKAYLEAIKEGNAAYSAMALIKLSRTSARRYDSTLMTRPPLIVAATPMPAKATSTEP